MVEAVCVITNGSISGFVEFKELKHYLGSTKVTGPPKRSLLPDRRRLGDCNTRVLLSGT